MTRTFRTLFVLPLLLFCQTMLVANTFTRDGDFGFAGRNKDYRYKHGYWCLSFSYE